MLTIRRVENATEFLRDHAWTRTFLERYSLTVVRPALIAFRFNRPVGFLLFDADRISIQARGTCVRRSARGEGVASRMWLKLIAAAKKTERKKIRVATATGPGRNLIRNFVIPSAAERGVFVEHFE